MKGVSGRRMPLGRRILFDVAGLAVFLLCAFPVYWMISTSFLTRREIRFLPELDGRRGAQSAPGLEQQGGGLQQRQ